MKIKTVCCSVRSHPLASCIGAALVLASPLATATSWTVNSCDEGNSGSGTTGTLRYAAAHAANNDSIDLTSLTCGSITLHTGAIVFTQDNISLNGPGLNNLAISGKYNGTIERDRIITHTGAGKLSISNLSVGKGYRYVSNGYARGGCIYSAGTVYASHIGVYDCGAYTKAAGRAQGGGIFGNAVEIKYSVVSYNAATGAPMHGGYGGGIYSASSLAVKYSTISSNSAGNSAEKKSGVGGGIFVYQNLLIENSTISGNDAGDNGGGIYAHDDFNSAKDALTIINSTISGNSAGYFTGGLTTDFANVYLYNNTVVSNTAGIGRYGSFPFTYLAPGIATKDNYGPIDVRLYSNLVANNVYSSIEYDLSVRNRASTSVTFVGSNNLVRATFAAVPSDTIKISCPVLGPLRNNGGLTQTHELLAGSPGINQGINKRNVTDDQRGVGYPRVAGSHADIGAYERQVTDDIFDTNFEGCPILF